MPDVTATITIHTTADNENAKAVEAVIGSLLGKVLRDGCNPVSLVRDTETHSATLVVSYQTYDGLPETEF